MSHFLTEKSLPIFLSQWIILIVGFSIFNLLFEFLGLLLDFIRSTKIIDTLETRCKIQLKQYLKNSCFVRFTEFSTDKLAMKKDSYLFLIRKNIGEYSSQTYVSLQRKSIRNKHDNLDFSTNAKPFYMTLFISLNKPSFI